VLVLLAAFVVYAALRELRKAPPVGQAAAPAEASHHAPRPARTAAEERFSQALWGIHSEVRTAAVRMTFAGLAYKMGDGDRASVRARVTPLTEVFQQAQAQLRALDTPPAMQETRDRYAQALQQYARASQEMVKVAQAGDEAHLLRAHEMSEQASTLLLQVGDRLWPGEIKPN